MKKRTKTLLLIVILLAIISLITYNYSMAKYVSNSFWNYYLGTKGFYFSSELLGTTKVTNVNNNWDYDNTYFRIKNSENDFLISDYDITYTVRCSVQNEAANYSKCILNGSDSDTITGVLLSSSKCVNNLNLENVNISTKEECEKSGYEWKIQETYEDLYFNVVKTGENDINYASVLIEVTSTSPYKKILLGEFNLSSIEMLENGLDVNYKEFDNYSRVIITNSYDEKKCVKLSWDPLKLRIDDKNENIESFKIDNNSIKEVIFNIDKKNSISYLFYKNDMNEINKNEDFDLVESNECK